MARGNLPAQTPTVPADSFISFDLLYRAVQDIDKDVGLLEGLRKKVVETFISNTTLTVDHELSLKLQPYRRVRIAAKIFATANVKLRVGGPAGALVFLASSTMANGSGSTSVFDTAYHTSDVVFSAPGVWTYDALIYNGANAGNLSISWAQNTSSGTPAGLYSGSQLQYSLVD